MCLTLQVHHPELARAIVEKGSVTRAVVFMLELLIQ